MAAVLLLLVALALLDRPAAGDYHPGKYMAYYNYTYLMPGDHGPGSPRGTLLSGNWTLIGNTPDAEDTPFTPATWPILSWPGKGRPYTVAPEYQGQVTFDEVSGNLTILLNPEHPDPGYSGTYRLVAESSNDGTGDYLPIDTTIVWVHHPVPPELLFTPTERFGHCRWMVTCKQSEPPGTIYWTEVPANGRVTALDLGSTDQILETDGEDDTPLSCRTEHTNGPTMHSQVDRAPACPDPRPDLEAVKHQMRRNRTDQTVTDWLMILSADATVALGLLAVVLWLGRPHSAQLLDQGWTLTADDLRDDNETVLLCADNPSV